MADALARLTAALTDRYAIQRELGRGGMATVYLAQDLKHRRLVALKVLRPELGVSLGPERFLREIHTAANLSHPHILPLYDSGDVDGTLYYVMPYVDGESLRDRLQRERQLPVDEAVQIAREVAGALAYAHSHNLIHRDIKPENILLSSGEAVLTDFGIARAIALASEDRMTETGLAVGTAAYMSPEQASAGVVDARTDVYSLGCVLYEMLAGDPPFTGSTAQAIMARRSLEAPPGLLAVRDTVSPVLEQVVLKALARTPGDRWKTVAEFAEELRRATGGAQAVSGTNPASIPPRGRLLRTTIAAAVVAGAALGALRLSGRLPWAPAVEAGDAAGEYSVAVLYFDNLSPDSGNAYLADGLTEEVISRLGGVGRLQVKRSSREAVRRVRDTVPDYLVAVGRALSVRYLVEGSVRSAGGRVKVAARLLRSTDGFRVWGDEYERPATDLLVLQTEIANSVATGITGRLTPVERKSLSALPTQNPEAYDRLIRGNYNFALRDKGFERALTEYEEALRLDPGFSQAHGRIALTYATCSNWRFRCRGLDHDSLLARGFAAADKALDLDSTTADAWLALGLLRVERNPLTLDGVLEVVEKALRLEPANPEAHHVLGFVRMLTGEDSAAIAEYNAALALEPDRVQTRQHLSGLRRTQGHLVEALALIDSAVSVSPNPGGELYEFRSSIKRRMGNLAGARVDAETAVRLKYSRAIELALLDLRAGDTVGARRRVERLSRDLMGSGKAHDYADGSTLGIGYTALGDTDRALQALERVRPLSAAFWYKLRDPDLDPIRNSPRFEHLVAATRPPRR